MCIRDRKNGENNGLRKETISERNVSVLKIPWINSGKKWGAEKEKGKQLSAQKLGCEARGKLWSRFCWKCTRNSQCRRGLEICDGDGFYTKLSQPRKYTQLWRSRRNEGKRKQRINRGRSGEEEADSPREYDRSFGRSVVPWRALRSARLCKILQRSVSVSEKKSGFQMKISIDQPIRRITIMKRHELLVHPSYFRIH